MTGSYLFISGRADYRDTLRLIPQGFHNLARQYVQDVARKMYVQYERDPGLVGNAIDEAVGCALSGLSAIRWYLLYDTERSAAAEQAWRDGGVVELCLHMRSLHQAERVLLVLSHGEAEQADAIKRLSFLHEKAGFSMVVTTRGLDQGFHVSEWAASTGLPHVHLVAEEAYPEQYPKLLEKVMPQAVCLLTNDALSKSLAEIAFRKGVKTVSCLFGEWSR